MVATKRAFVFPGQGSQFVGMGKTLSEAFPEAREVFEKADAVLGFSLSRICFEGPEDELKKTPVTQPALLTCSLAALAVLRGKGVAFGAVAGHSLGAYTALAAAGVFSAEDAVRLVRRRGELMEEAGRGRGSMGVILQLEDGKVTQACQEASDAGVVEPANMNCPGQIVISGEKPAVAKALERAKALGAKRVLELPVSGPFHSSLMRPAQEDLRSALSKVSFRTPEVPFYSDIDAARLEDPDDIRESLVRQLISPVVWTETVRKMVAEGFTGFVEVGPGKVLTGLIKKIHPDAEVSQAGDAATINLWG
jgi:[acyl-carrier-protein] S-malonyltransferase